MKPISRDFNRLNNISLHGALRNFSSEGVREYCLGDAVGAPFEGGDKFNVSEAIQHLLNIKDNTQNIQLGTPPFPTCTDESSVAVSAHRFAFDWLDNRDWGVDWPCWFAFHEKNRFGGAKYGQTWKRHFALVKMLVRGKHGNTEVMQETLNSIAKEEDSFGNGCLGIVFPVTMAMMRDMGSMTAYKDSILHKMVSGSHASERAEIACRLLYDYFRGVNGRTYGLLDLKGDIINEAMRTNTYQTIRNPANSFEVLGCLYHAVSAACNPSYNQHMTQERMISYASRKGGDVDSYLSLAFLLNWFSRRPMFLPTS